MRVGKGIIFALIPEENTVIVYWEGHIAGIYCLIAWGLELQGQILNHWLYLSVKRENLFQFASRPLCLIALGILWHLGSDLCLLTFYASMYGCV